MTTGTSGEQQPGGGVAALARDGALAGQWQLDPEQSTVEFRVPHFWHMIQGARIRLGVVFSSVGWRSNTTPCNSSAGFLAVHRLMMQVVKKHTDHPAIAP